MAVVIDHDCIKLTVVSQMLRTELPTPELVMFAERVADEFVSVHGLESKWRNRDVLFRALNRAKVDVALRYKD